MSLYSTCKTWTIEASDFLRKEPKMLLAYLSMLKHTEKVMGKANYLISQCVFVCPFYNESKCNHGQCPYGHRGRSTWLRGATCAPTSTVSYGTMCLSEVGRSQPWP